jgi:hypothetical protein
MTPFRFVNPSLVVLASLTLTVEAGAQKNDTLQVGVRYRITLPEFADRPGPQFPPSRWLAGELVERRGDTLVVRPHPTTGAVSVPLSSIHRLERSRGVSRVASAVEGAVGGAILGVVLGNVFYGLGVRGSGFNTRWQATGTMAAHTAGGALIAGALFPAERWRRVATPTP